MHSFIVLLLYTVGVVVNFQSLFIIVIILKSITEKIIAPILSWIKKYYDVQKLKTADNERKLKQY